MRAIIHAAILMLLVTPVRSEMTFNWQQGPEMPHARDHLGCGMVDGLFVVAGGAYWKDGKKLYSAETIAYSPSKGKWIRLPYLPRPGAYGASAVMRDRQGHDQLLIAGGANADGATSACFRLVKVKGVFHWKRLPELPRPLAGAKGAVIGDRFCVFGGAPGMEGAGIRNSRPSLFELGLDGKSGWKEIAVAGTPAGRVGSAVAACGGRLFVFGGYGVQPDGTLGNFQDAYVLDLSRSAAPNWKRLKDMPIPSRWTTALGLDRRFVGLFGGYGESFLDEVFVYDTERDVYLPCAGLPQPLAVMAGGLAEEGTVYLAGGEDRARHRSASLFIGRLSSSEPY